MHTNHDERDTLDDILDTSTPRLSELDAKLRDEAIAVTVAAEREARPAGVLRRMPRPVVFGVTAALLFGGASAAAAVTAQDWVPWAQTPDAAYTYTLPSGAVCEQRMGNVESADEAVNQAVRDYVAGVDLLALADVDAALETLRTGENTEHLADGTQVPGGYGTEYYSADAEYYQALSLAVSDLIIDELERQGFDLEDPDLNLTYEGQADCPGAHW